MKPANRPAPMQDVLIVADGDTIEVFGERLNARIVRVPVADTIKGERVADDCLEQLLPPRWRKLWRRDLLRNVGTTRPLRPEMVLRALTVHDCLAALNAAIDGGGAR